MEYKKGKRKTEIKMERQCEVRSWVYCSNYSYITYLDKKEHDLWWAKPVKKTALTAKSWRKLQKIRIGCVLLRGWERLNDAVSTPQGTKGKEKGCNLLEDNEGTSWPMSLSQVKWRSYLKLSHKKLGASFILAVSYQTPLEMPLYAAKWLFKCHVWSTLS